MKSLAELAAIRDRMKGQMDSRGVESENDIRIVVGMATCGIAAGARPVLDTLLEEVGKRNLHNVKITQTGCVGMCRLEPIVEVYEPDGNKVTYVKVNPEKAVKIVAEHIVNGNVCKEFVVGQE